MKTREQKRAEAESRHAARQERTPEEQLAILRSRGITSGAEWDRLQDQIAALDDKEADDAIERARLR